MNLLFNYTKESRVLFIFVMGLIVYQDIICTSCDEVIVTAETGSYASIKGSITVARLPNLSYRYIATLTFHKGPNKADKELNCNQRSFILNSSNSPDDLGTTSAFYNEIYAYIITVYASEGVTAVNSPED